MLFRYTATGRAMRACAINPTALRLLGIRSGPIATRAFVLSGLLAGLVGAVTVPITLVRWDAGLTVGLVAFIAAAIGGFTSPTRTVVAGLALGVIESMASGLISSQYRSAYVYGVLVVYLLAEDALGHDGLLRRLRARWSSSGGPSAAEATSGRCSSPPSTPDDVDDPPHVVASVLVPPLLLLAATLVPLVRAEPEGPRRGRVRRAQRDLGHRPGAGDGARQPDQPRPGSVHADRRLRGGDPDRHAWLEPAHRGRSARW